MSEGVSESRFNMWRAVFAMAHADHVVTAEERAFMENYMAQVPFSEDQLATLREDVAEPQNIHEMFSLITEPEDRGTFFQFARELVWCDGDLDAQEDAIKGRLKSDLIDQLGLKTMENELRKSRAESRMQRTAEDRKFAKDADDVVGLGGFLRKMIGR